MIKRFLLVGTVVLLTGCKTIPINGSVSVGALGGIIDITVAGGIGDGEPPTVEAEIKDAVD